MHAVLRYTDFAMTWPGDVTTYLVKGSLDPAVAIPEYFRMYQDALWESPKSRGLNIDSK